MLVCQCNNVDIDSIREFLKEYPDCPKHIVKLALSVGTRCQQCVRGESQITDCTFEEAWDILNK